MTARATRRGLLALAPAAALAPASVAGIAPHPDAKLLAACQHFRALVRQENELLGRDNPAADAEVDAMRPAMYAALDAVCDCHATTLAGLVARAEVMIEYTPEAIRGDGHIAKNQTAALLRDLLAMGGRS